MGLVYIGVEASRRITLSNMQDSAQFKYEGITNTDSQVFLSRTYNPASGV